jgi:hypothetical protein
MRNFSTKDEIISFRTESDSDLAAQENEREYIAILRIVDQLGCENHPPEYGLERYLLAAFQEEIDGSETIAQTGANKWEPVEY